MSASAATTLRSVALLERSVGYTRTALAGVRPDLLQASTPCAAWDLEDLLLHMDDALAAFTEAAALGRVDLAPLADLPPAARLVESLRLRACDVLAHWSTVVGDDPVAIGGVWIDPGLLAATGALEITVHGWDVGQAVGLDHPIPPALAESLLLVAPDLVAAEDRATRFGPEREADSADPAERLLGFLGR